MGYNSPQIVCGGCQNMMMTIEVLGETYRAWAEEQLTQKWGAAIIVTRGRVHDASRLPGFVALKDEKPVGLVTYRIDHDSCELMTLNSLLPRIGVGSALLTAVKEEAAAAGCRRLWLITTNDNMIALRFYQQRGFRLAALHQNALDNSRRLKPQIPLIGLGGIPLRDEIELEILLGPT